MTTVDRILAPFSPELLSTGLLDESELDRLRRHCRGFPATPRHRLFLEYRLAPAFVFEGYGHGYDRWELPQLLESGTDFASAGRLALALADDPFAEDRDRYLDLTPDSDPQWIEYDDTGALSDDPGVYFDFPARFRSPTAGRLEELELALGQLMPRGESALPPVWDVLGALVAGSAAAGRDAGLYRLGLCTARQPGWVRIIVSGLACDSLDVLRRDLVPGLAPDAGVWVADHLAARGDDDPQIAASITVVHGGVRAIDLEFPYFHREHRTGRRREDAAAFCEALCARGVVAPATAQAMAAGAATKLEAGAPGLRAQLMLNHCKFGVYGATLGRVKAYFELLIRDDRRGGRRARRAGAGPMWRDAR